jgi:hypothetical protein
MRNFIARLHAFGETLLFPLCKLNEIQFRAPWEPTGSRCGG